MYLGIALLSQLSSRLQRGGHHLVSNLHIYSRESNEGILGIEGCSDNWEYYMKY